MDAGTVEGAYGCPHRGADVHAELEALAAEARAAVLPAQAPQPVGDKVLELAGGHELLTTLPYARLPAQVAQSAPGAARKGPKHPAAQPRSDASHTSQRAALQIGHESLAASRRDGPRNPATPPGAW